MTRQLTGRVPAQAIRRTELPRLPADLLARYAAIDDLTGTASDAMDHLGLRGAVPASQLAPSLPGRRLVGQAVTVRNVERSESPTLAAASGVGRMGEHEAYNQAAPGDVVVIEGLTGISNMGGQSATVAHRAGCAGAVIDGSFRDPDASRGHGFPIWSRGVTPITGKWRLETVEINGRVRIAGVSVDAADLVLADEAGVVFVPFAQAEAVLAQAERIAAGDSRQKADIAAGVDLATLAATRYK
ncbi:RraA family protein [Xylophilus sp.]|uniref:RraA family protein n=1 Tax=Xylophilus sp. TaxID=2653893 RepID=UPI0013BC8068|nr:RraA family protein [Xylophilus sp.]KAF1043446.1 MAG: 4-hydroxy-4-methyl-2-oxoglutarate aldolase/4-carboxy-4-hydroxy-2-oxoadipate aldolase [Xylophilus sp.]